MLCLLSSTANLHRSPKLVNKSVTHHFCFKQGQRTVTKTGAHQHSRQGQLPPGSVLIPMQVHQAEACSDKVKLLQMYDDFKAKGFPEVQDIDVEGLQKLLQQPGRVLLLDVRTPDEQAVSVIDGPVVLKSDFEENREQYRDAQLVSYCTVGARSGKYAKMLTSEGFKVLNLKGSIVAWTQAGLPLVTLDRKATKQVHVFGNTWALQGNEYTAVAFKPAKATLEGIRSILPPWLANNLLSLLAVVAVIFSVLIYKAVRQ